MIPRGWTFDTEQIQWWHDACGIVGWGGLGEEQYDRQGRLLAVLCVDCGECFDLTRRPVGVAA